jgi:hypothetical protein
VLDPLVVYEGDSLLVCSAAADMLIRLSWPLAKGNAGTRGLCAADNPACRSSFATNCHHVGHFLNFDSELQSWRI